MEHDLKLLARALNLYLDAPRVDLPLTLALASVIPPDSLRGDEDSLPPVVAWASEDGSRYALAVAGSQLYYATVAADAETGKGTIFRRSDVVSVQADQITPGESFGRETTWFIRAWTVTMRSGEVFSVPEIRPWAAREQAPEFMRSLIV